MLTRQHSIFHAAGFTVEPDRLVRGRHGHYVALAGRMLDIYRRGIGASRGELHRRVEGLFEDEADCPARRIAGFIKLLDDAGRFSTDRQGRAADLRLRVFDLAAPLHPLVEAPDRLFENQAGRVKQQIASEIGLSWPQIEREMFADFPAHHVLSAFEDYPDAESLLARYNVAQAQVLLYDAVEMVIVARRDFKTLFRYVKLARLLHEIERLDDTEYRIRLTGPASALGQTRRYGVAMAVFLPALLSCRDWKMHARIRMGGRDLSFTLTSESGLRGHRPAPAEFDSRIEENFAAKFGPERGGWRLEREGDFLVAGQKVFVPDFVFRHDDGTRVFLEIVGYWTPEYLRTKWATLRAFADHPILVAVAAPLALTDREAPADALTYRTSLKIAPVLERLESFRAQKCEK